MYYIKQPIFLQDVKSYTIEVIAKVVSSPLPKPERKLTLWLLGEIILTIFNSITTYAITSIVTNIIYR